MWESSILLASDSSWVHFIFGAALFLMSLFLILLVLVQRGKGGGLAGALGGQGGQSAFGTKAGDTFTKVTIGVALVWMALCVATIFFVADRPPVKVSENDGKAAEKKATPESTEELEKLKAIIEKAKAEKGISPLGTGETKGAPATVTPETPASGEKTEPKKDAGATEATTPATPKAEEKTEPKAEEKTEPKAEPKTEAKPETKEEPKPEAPKTAEPAKIEAEKSAAEKPAEEKK